MTRTTGTERAIFMTSSPKRTEHMKRLWEALLRAEEELPKLAAPDGTVAVRIEDLRAVLEQML